MRALFLDRDGVVNVDHGYVCSVERFEFIPNIFGLVREANLRGYLVVVVTNQSGIARGLFTEEQFVALNGWMLAEFASRGGRVDAIYYCPHHPDQGVGKYKAVCTCRKPAPGMILTAVREMDIDVETSVMIGNSPSDLEAAKAAGIGTSLLFDGKTDDRDDLVLRDLCDYDQIFTSHR